jgi:hypothetical protein
LKSFIIQRCFMRFELDILHVSERERAYVYFSSTSIRMIQVMSNSDVPVYLCSPKLWKICMHV